MSSPGNHVPSVPTRFWAAAEHLVATSEIVVDRPKGSSHPMVPEAIYPVAYGYLKGTTAIEGEGIDVGWARWSRRLLPAWCAHSI